jgi:hypothetical protein
VRHIRQEVRDITVDKLETKNKTSETSETGQTTETQNIRPVKHITLDKWERPDK